ncbi:hypothetical protein SAY87_008329 [Trapa incisa]|uniref:Uncharacterized protein n=1 Tax=Trapa incisa TaxID=236973 RepID=A0AAN7KPK7_9MYRT|nr:hypothetical protein SAY87_008329 [Trapa incisa]
MGCFCFGTSKLQRHSKRALVSPSSHQILGGATRVPLPSGPTRKTVVSELPAAPVTESNPNKKLPVAQLEDAKKKNKRVAFDLNVETHELPAEAVFHDHPEREEEDDETAEGEETQEEGTLYTENATLSAESSRSHPVNNRYCNCAGSDGESEGIDTEKGGVEEEDDGYDHVSYPDKFVEPESSGSLFSLPIDSRKYGCVAGDEEEKEVNSAMPMAGSQEKKCKIQHAHSVLKAVENLSQWEKVVKARSTAPPLQNQEKENVKVEHEFAFLVLSTPNAASDPVKRVSNKLACQGIAVDTSLSSWLNQSESTPKPKTGSRSVGNSPLRRCNRPRGAEDKPVLGMLTVEDAMPLSSSNSPTWSRGWSLYGNDKPIIGTVGNYWICTGQAVDSDSYSSCRRESSKTCKEVHDQEACEY